MEEEKENSASEGQKLSKKKLNKPLIIFIVAFSLLAIVGCFIVFGHVFDKKENNNAKNDTNSNQEVSKDVNNNEEKNNTEENNNTDVSIENIDFETIRKELKSKVTNGRNAYVVKCEDKSNEINGPLTDEKFIMVSPDTIDIVIDKLKSAKKFTNVVTGYELCPPENILYYVGGETYYNEKDILIDYGTDGKSLLVGVFGDNNISGVFEFSSSDEVKGFIESLNTSTSLEKELNSKLSSIGLLKQQGYYDESEKLITFNNNDKWFKQNKLTANDLSTKELIRTALLNVDKSKASLGEVNTCKNTYSLKEINDSLGEIINNKPLTLNDLKNIDAELTDIHIKFQNDDICIQVVGSDVGPSASTFVKTAKVEKSMNDVYLYQKVAYCDYTDNSYNEIACYKDYNMKTIIDKNKNSSILTNLSWDKYNTYKVTFKIINGNYYFDSYELVK